ncbi:alpha/beta hydrolase family protein, partial [candidate division KSB1 bacterium]
DFRIPEYADGKPLILFCHGFKGFKNWGGWQYAMDKICANGFYTIAMNFSYNGIGADLNNFTELDKFAWNTIGNELDDIKMLLNEVKTGSQFTEVNSVTRIGLIGHSRGGATAILSAAQTGQFSALVTWASLANFENYMQYREQWHRDGYVEYENRRTNEIMRMNVNFLTDLETSTAERNILLAESRLGIPHLIIHGGSDEAVAYDHAQKLFDASDKTKTKLEIINGGSHTFGTEHPFHGSTDAFDTVINRTIEWFRTYFMN